MVSLGEWLCPVSSFPSKYSPNRYTAEESGMKAGLLTWLSLTQAEEDLHFPPE